MADSPLCEVELEGLVHEVQGDEERFVMAAGAVPIIHRCRSCVVVSTRPVVLIRHTYPRLFPRRRGVRWTSRRTLIRCRGL